jgi:hypothetical protein
MLKKAITSARALSRSNLAGGLERFAAVTMRGSGTVGTGLERYASNFYPVNRLLFQPFQPFHMLDKTHEYVGKRLFFNIFMPPGKKYGTAGTAGTGSGC